MIITRFAPSPTGMLHIGGARTALFNYLYAKKNNGKFLLRIEDTDKKRYSRESFASIIDGLDWLGLKSDEEPYLQSKHIEEHLKIAKQMVESGFAYLSIEEGVIRLKIPVDSAISFADNVYGNIEVHSSQIEDVVLVRSDGTPTFILSMAVDDHNMKVTDVIRGSDHITNTLKQILIFKAMGWELPKFTHIPLIHNDKGEKLSKRDGALSVLEYKHMGFLPLAVKNYLLRLGWGHENHEIIDERLAIELFGLEGIRPSPARFDITKLEHLNQHYINKMDDDELAQCIIPFLDEPRIIDNLTKQLIGIFKSRSSTLKQLAQDLQFYFVPIKPDALEQDLVSLVYKIPLEKIVGEFSSLPEWSKINIEACIKNSAKVYAIPAKEIYIAIRLVILGKTESPSISLIMETLSKSGFMERVKPFIK